MLGLVPTPGLGCSSEELSSEPLPLPGICPFSAQHAPTPPPHFSGLSCAPLDRVQPALEHAHSGPRYSFPGWRVAWGKLLVHLGPAPCSSLRLSVMCLTHGESAGASAWPHALFCPLCVSAAAKNPLMHSQAPRAPHLGRGQHSGFPVGRMDSDWACLSTCLSACTSARLGLVWSQASHSLSLPLPCGHCSSFPVPPLYRCLCCVRPPGHPPEGLSLPGILLGLSASTPALSLFIGSGAGGLKHASLGLGQPEEALGSPLPGPSYHLLQMNS